MNIERYTFAEKLHTDPEPSTLSRNLHSLTNSPKVLVLKLGSFIFTWVNLEKSSSQMRHSNAKKVYILSDGFISILFGSVHILHVGWVVSSDGENIGQT